MVPKETKCIMGNAQVANGENVLLISATISYPRFSPALSPKREGRSRLLPPLLFALPFCKYCLTTKQIHLTPKLCYAEDERTYLSPDLEKNISVQEEKNSVRKFYLILFISFPEALYMRRFNKIY